MRRRRLTTVRHRPRDSVLRLLKVDLLILLVLLLAGGLYALNRHPIRLGTEDPPTAAGAAHGGAEEGDVLLLLPPALAGVEAESFESLDFAANWVNVLFQEFGVARVSVLDEFTPSVLDRTVLVVVPRSVARLMTTGQVATLEQFAEEGGRVLVELPTAVWQPLVGVVGDPAGYRPTRRITAFDGALVRGELRDDVIQAPLATVMSPIQVAEVVVDPEVEVLMEVDGLPGFVRRPLGDGEVYVLYFDLARAVGVIQQGSPAADWEIERPSVALPEGLTRAASLVAHGDLRRTSVPSADLLERQILSVATLNRPTPRIWAFPGLHTGALIMTHSGLPSAEAGGFMFEWEAESEQASTVFVRADELDDLPEALDGRSGLLLVPPEVPFAPERRLGIFGLTPFRRPLSLREQVERLEREVTDQPIVTRVADGLWHPDYGQTFRILAGLGVDADSSYGPAYQPTDLEALEGYSFGTGLPFFPLDRNGLLLPVLEVPCALNDGPALEGDWSERFVERAGRVYNELVVADWRTGTMTAAPRAEVVLTWRSLFERARERGLWITDLASFVRFWRLRSEVRLRSTFSVSERRLSVWVEVWSIEGLGGQLVMPSVAFEARYEDRPVERITRNGEDVPFVDLGRTADGVFHVYAVPEGTSRLEIAYRGPIEIEE